MDNFSIKFDTTPTARLSSATERDTTGVSGDDSGLKNAVDAVNLACAFVGSRGQKLDRNAVLPRGVEPSRANGSQIKERSTCL